MSCELLTLSLDRLESSDWSYFESLCSKYLSSEYNTLRTMAATNGDGGRDSELFCSEDDSSIAIQYSVTKSWKSKIQLTKNRLEKEFPNTNYIIYLTNQVIGANSDDLKKDLRTKGYFLDIRDRQWFIERQFKNSVTERAAQELINVIAIPYLESANVIRQRRPALTSDESKIALTYLSMQWEDETTDKGLTKIAFEALVLASLKNTNSDNRMTHDNLFKAVYKLIPSTTKHEANQYIESAINKLKKKRIRHWVKENEFCLTFEEADKIKTKLAIQENDEKELERFVIQLLENIVPEYKELEKVDCCWVAEKVLKVLDTFLSNSGEQFARSVTSGDIYHVDIENLRGSIVKLISQNHFKKPIVAIFPDIAIEIIKTLLHTKNEQVRLLLKKVADSYTLYAFLRETPDVQSVTKKIFSHGNIWLDTTIILPLLAETLIEDYEPKRYSHMVKSLVESGVSFFITSGVINEILHHIQISVICSSKGYGSWTGKVPFLYSNYLEHGNKPIGFLKWVELFRGTESPEDDLVDYLKEEWGIEFKNLSEESDKIDVNLRYAVERLWEEAHTKRRKSDKNLIDETTTAQLIKNDVESYLGIIALRKEEKSKDLGYKNWWLTIDSIAWKIRDKIKTEFRDETPYSPLMSLDFLLNSFSFGPSRGLLDRNKEQHLPLFLDFELSEFMPAEILEVAEKTRLESKDLPEHVIKRNVRDACNKLKRHCGELTKLQITGKEVL